MPSIHADQSHPSFTLRNDLRSKRRQLSRLQQHQHAKKISQRIIHSDLYKHARHIALYLSTDGEADLAPLLNKLHKHYKKCYLPVILSKQQGHMLFAPYHKNTPMRKNCFGILEPVYQKKQLKSAMQLDLILAPLVGFDEQGNRMGMGGGFYDRALQNLKHKSQINRVHPKLVGIAHEIQKVPQLESHPWDISLHAIVTESRLSFF